MKKSSRHWLSVTINLAAWLIVMVFLALLTFSQNNPHSFTPDWFKGDQNQVACPQIYSEGLYNCESAVLYNSVGFPIEYSNATTSGPYWLAWTINLGLLGLVGIGYGYLLHRRRRLGWLVGVVLIVVSIVLR